MGKVEKRRMDWGKHKEVKLVHELHKAAVMLSSIGTRFRNLIDSSIDCPTVELDCFAKFDVLTIDISLHWFSQRRSRTPHFWGCAPRVLWPPNLNSAEIFVQCTYAPSFVILCLLVWKLSCWQTNKQTPLKTSGALCYAAVVVVCCYGRWVNGSVVFYAGMFRL